MTNDFEPFVKASHFFLITGSVDCYSCHQPTPASALLVDGFLEDDGDGGWMDYEERALLRCPERLDPASLASVAAAAPWMRFGRSETAKTEYLANHCQRCASLQGDWFLHKPGEIFFQTHAKEMQSFRIERFDQPLVTRAYSSLSSWLDELELPQ